MADEQTLKRSLSLPLMILYGVGTTIGAGIYALIGEVTRVAGTFAPTAFLMASLLAGFSAFTFAELSARFPVSAGEARYVREGLRSNALSLVVGLLVVAAGSVSAATIANGFAGYFQEFVPLPRAAAVAGVVILLGLIAAWGIGQSVATAGIFTLLEIGGLLLVIGAGGGAALAQPVGLVDLAPPLETAAWSGVFVGTFLAFYAFIGFEDMVNVAEEVKAVTRVLPTAIILTLAITLVLYLAVALVAVRAVPIDDLVASDAPLALVFERSTGRSSIVISAIAIVATINGALIQIIMASRVLYGLARQGSLPAGLARVNARTRTPLIATALVTAVIVILGVAFRLAALAEATSTITLTVFALVNLALWRIKRRDPRPPGLRVFPLWVPVIGFAVSAAFVLAGLVRWLVM